LKKWKKDKYATKVHFGSAAHQAATWVTAFGLLQVFVDACADGVFDSTTTKSTTNAADWPKDSEWSMPPPLTEDLVIANVTEHWNKGTIDCAAMTTNNNNATSSRNPCVLTWIAAPTGIFSASKLQQFMTQHVSHNDGWGSRQDKELYGWSNKLGWEAKKPNAKFTMTMAAVQKPLRTVTIFYMKSYGEKWANATARVTVAVPGDSQNYVVQDLLGYHNSNTSITYTERIQLPQVVAAGSDLELSVELVGGTTFKITGMMFCNPSLAITTAK